jgi:ATP phosphoribosyltransferase
LAKNKNLSSEKLAILEQLVFRIQAVLKSKNTKYILMNVPNEKIQEVSKILPVLKSPTIVPLVEEGWSSLHSVIEEKRFWEVIDQLKKAGAEGILIIPIEKMIL